MNKNDLICSVAEKANITKTTASIAIDATFDVIAEALSAGDKVQLVGFGSFEVKDRAERTGRNLKTKEPIRIPASKTPVFKAGKPLKLAVEGK